jgi:hypothetical protein
MNIKYVSLMNIRGYVHQFHITDERTRARGCDHGVMAVTSHVMKTLKHFH